MGQFSWLDCVTEEQIYDDEERDVYALVPREFGGGHIIEHCYDGYGRFGGKDIYDLVANWNRKYLAKHPEYIIPRSGKMVKDYAWYEYYQDLSLTAKDIEHAMNKKYFEYRLIGIDIACYDKDNENLPYPIKITYNENARYESCLPSDSDPDQGWRTEYDDDDNYDKDDYYYYDDEDEDY